MCVGDMMLGSLELEMIYAAGIIRVSPGTMAQRLTTDFVQNLLADTEADLTVTDVRVHPGSDRGDNYTAMLYRVHVKGRRTSGELWERPLIYKCLPTSAERRQAYRSDALFSNEVAFYTRALPALLNFQRSRGVENEGFGAVPRCYTAHQDLLLLEDLRDREFIMLDRKAGLDEAQCRAVLSELGRFHALSLAMKALQPEQFRAEVSSAVHEVLFLPENEEWYRGYYAAASRSAVASVRELLGPSYAGRLERFTRDCFARMTRLVHGEPDEGAEADVNVLCHGDCWTNNILFRLEHQRVLQVCFLDFQLARLGSPALDLCNLLYCCTSRELRRQHLDELLRHYHESLQSALERLGAPAHLLSLDTLRRHMRRYAAFGLGLALDMIPISTCDGDEAPDLYCGRPSEVTDHPAEQTGCALLQAAPTLEGKRRMAELVQELVDQGLI